MRKLLFVSLLGAASLLSGCAPLVIGGAGVGALMVEDRRTPGTYILDEEIELTAAHRARQPEFDPVHVNFTSYNRRVLVTGEAPTAELKAKTEELVRKVPNVRDVVNELYIASPSSLPSRSTDSYTTAKVKARLIEDKRINAVQVKVVTERGNVYLMGIVRRAEATIAADIAAHTSGVLKVVTAFEYMD